MRMYICTTWLYSMDAKMAQRQQRDNKENEKKVPILLLSVRLSWLLLLMMILSNTNGTRSKNETIITKMMRRSKEK